ncbi:MAG: glycosyltransferase family 39 protein, partial [Planctomycetota bacterium]|nr:glycosyltransferase family 39 protein [Planctomycetota bacterium]
MMLGTSKPAPRSAWIALAALTALGAALRLYGLGRDSFWMDELIRVTEARMDTFEHLREFLRGDVHPPGYVMLLHAINRWFGQDEWHFRLPSALAGIAAIPVVFLLGRRLYSHREGLAAAAFTAVLWCPISYSQEAAPYMILVLITAGATCCWLPMIDELRRTGRPRYGLAAGYAACATLGYYTHFFGIGFFGLQALYGFWLCRKSLRALGLLFGVYVASVIGFGWWLPDFLTQLTSRHATATWMKPPSDTFFFRQVRYFFNREHAFAWLAFAAYLFLIADGVRTWRRAGAGGMVRAGWGGPPPP